MRVFLFISVLLLSSFILQGQFASKTSYDLFIQSRLLHQPNEFSAGQEFGFGGRLNIQTIKPLSIDIGVQLNYAQYEDQKNKIQETFFVDYFKGSRMDYFNFQKVKHLNIEIPAGFNLSLIGLETSNLAWVGTLTPSFNLFSWSEGSRFEEQIQVNTSIKDLFQQENVFPLDKHYLFDDFLFSTGLHLNFRVAKSKAVFIESGYEYSMKGKSSGMFLRTGLKF